jgi:Acetyl-CoA dehydrogenase C-terminal like/Acyl-CoA dehydrogenase, C-terminal domain
VLLGTESLQTLGGSGFLLDYPLEQYVRDAKIDTLYEGTTAIQGMDFFFRKIVRDKGAAIGQLSLQMQDVVKGGDGSGFLAAERELLGKAIDDLQAILGTMVGAVMASDPRRGGDPASLYKVGQNTTRLLLAAGDLVVAWLLLRQADVAHAALAAGPASVADRRFYEGKVAAASFFAKTVLPRLTAERAIAEATDNSLMELSEDAL